MKVKLIVSILLVFVFFSEMLAQENVLLSREYWKANPSLTQVKNDIALGNDPTALNKNAFDAITWALIEKADNKTVLFLLEYEGNDVNKLTHDGRTYIFWAAYKDNLTIMNHLLEKGAKTDIIDSHGYSLLNFSAVTGQLNTAIYDFCIAHGSNISEEKNKKGANALLLVAPFLKDTLLIDYFIDKGLDFNSKDTNGNTIFDYASKGGNIDMMKKLISLEALFQAPTIDGANAMILASRGTRNNTNSLATFKYLESLGISPNTTTKKGFTPLHALSFRNKDISIFEYFLGKGVDINQQDEDGNTVFFNAMYYNDLKTIEFLSQHVTNINVTNKEGKSALMIALSRNSLEVVSLLLEKGANVHLKDAAENTVSYYLLEAFNAEDQSSFNEKLELLETIGFSISEVQANGNTLYHLAAEKNDLALIKRLTAFTIPINAKNTDGMTPLHIAAMKATNTEILQFLVAQGADKTMKTTFDETVFDLANENEILKKQNVTLNFLQ